MIRFRYESIVVRGSRGKSLETIFRPMIPMIVFGPAGKYQVTGLVDTDADDTMLPDTLVNQLGVSLNPGNSSIITGVEGSQTVVWYASVDLEIPGAGGGYRWSAQVGFHAGHRIVFGHKGFLEYFTASFNGRSRLLTLTPNGQAPRSLNQSG